jgi:ferric-dicitrate binding protein FerR (iron transport regulator)
MMDETRNTNSEDAIGALVRLAGRRPQVPEDAMARVRAAVHDEWQQTMGRRKRTRWIGSVAAAAALVVTAVVMQRTTSNPAAPAPAARAVVATVQTLAGGAIGGDGAARHLLDSGSPILAGDSIETAGSAAASLQWGNATLRLDAGTRIRIASALELDLQRGAVYVASDHPSANGVTVKTPLGAVHDIGTQFEVRLSGDQIRVRVREGRIDLRQGAASHSAKAGIELDADAHGAVTQHAIPRNGAEWDWVVRAAPPIRLDGRTLAEVVSSVTREEGVTPVWSDATSRAAASNRLHGAVPLSPDEALDSALVASGLTARTDGDRLVIQRKR